MQEIWAGSLGQEDSLQEGTATYSSILAWRIPWAEEPSKPSESDTTEQLTCQLVKGRNF